MVALSLRFSVAIVSDQIETAKEEWLKVATSGYKSLQVAGSRWEWLGVAEG
eukprot:m.133331 g.133331  ORF g.133331 m.133331 type:complete len:51 (+) comp13943_c0_seq2:1729-1881(+)